jgi:hypothetical protein
MRSILPNSHSEKRARVVVDQHDTTRLRLISGCRVKVRESPQQCWIEVDAGAAIGSAEPRFRAPGEIKSRRASIPRRATSHLRVPRDQPAQAERRFRPTADTQKELPYAAMPYPVTRVLMHEARQRAGCVTDGDYGMAYAEVKVAKMLTCGRWAAQGRTIFELTVLTDVTIDMEEGGPWPGSARSTASRRMPRRSEIP